MNNIKASFWSPLAAYLHEPVNRKAIDPAAREVAAGQACDPQAIQHFPATHLHIVQF